MRTRLRSKVTLLFIVCAALLAVGGTAMAITADPSGNTAPAPTIQSDQADYAPGETVTLTGSNWQPGESVHINVNDDLGQTWNRDADVTADASGNISDSFTLPDWFVATYKVTATGAQSGVATTSFTDGTVRVQARPSGTTFSSGTFTRYSQPNCAGSAGTTDTPSTVGSTNGTGYSVGLGNSTDSLLVKVSAATNNAGSGFLNFGAEPTSDSSFIVENGAFDPTSDPKIVCINANYNGNKTFVVNFGTPVANNDSYSVNEDNTLNVAAPGVLSNDTGTANTAVKVSDPAHGTVTLNANGSFTYTPAADYNGPDSFTYKANNGGTSNSNTATVNITVNAVDDNPVAVNDTKTVLEDADATTIDVLANDTDIDGGPKTIASVTQPANGTVVITNGGSDLTYKPNANYCNDGSPTDDFNYTLNGGSEAKVSVTVTCVNDTPTISGTTGPATPDENKDTATGNQTYSVNANDVDGDTLSYQWTVVSGNGQIIGSSTASSAAVNFPDGPASVTLKVEVSDSNGGTDSREINVTVKNVNPTIGPFTVTGNSGIACIGSNNVVTLSFSITDPGDDTHSGTINWGNGITTFSGSTVTQQRSYGAGPYSITVTASDNNGGPAVPKSTTGTQNVSLLYNVSELQDPVNRTGMTMSVFKSGSTVPLKVIITDCNNQPVNGLVPKISFTRVTPNTPAIGINEGLSTQPNDTNFLMRDAGNGQYIYNLSTKSLVDPDATYNATITDSKTPSTYGPKVSQNFGLRSK
jgi:VCBS repeat-containing protein